MNICSVCQRCYEDAATICAEGNHGFLTAARAGGREIIAGYRLDVLLERDAPSETYRATHLASEKPVIINFVATDLARDPQSASQQIQNEMCSLAALNHPNVIRVYETGALENKELYAVMEAADGHNLREHIERASPLSETDAITIARQTAEGLEAVHGAGAVHRAISPANIILINDGSNNLSVKLQNFDFGGIRQQTVAAGASAVDARIDALRYLAPEQLTEQTADGQTDIYSLGIVLYEMLCGRSPYDALTAHAVVNQTISERPLEHLRFDVRALLTHIVRQSLQKRANLRPPTASNFARQLRHVEQLAAPAPIAFRKLPQTAANQPAPVVPIAFDRGQTSSDETFVEKSQPFDISPPKIADVATMILPVPNQVTELPVPVMEIRENAPDETTSFSKPTFFEEEETAKALFSTQTDQTELIENEETDSAEFFDEPILAEPNIVSGDVFVAAPIFAEEEPIASAVLETEPVFVRSEETDAMATIELETIDVLPVEEVNRSKARRGAANLINSFDRYAAPRRSLLVRQILLVGGGLAALLVAVVLSASFFSRQTQSSPQQTIAKTSSAPAAPPKPIEETVAETSDDESVALRQLGVSETAEFVPVAAEKSIVAVPLSEGKNQPFGEKTIKETKAKQKVLSADKPADEKRPSPTLINNGSNINNGATRPRIVAENGDSPIAQTNTSPDAMRAEKRRLLERAGQIDSRSGQPEIVLSPDGRRATMRFRKKYAVKEGQKNRAGELIQESQWIKSGNDWKIINRRDVKVINR